jgi:hypothetical protein
VFHVSHILFCLIVKIKFHMIKQTNKKKSLVHLPSVGCLSQFENKIFKKFLRIITIKNMLIAKYMNKIHCWGLFNFYLSNIYFFSHSWDILFVCLILWKQTMFIFILEWHTEIFGNHPKLWSRKRIYFSKKWYKK